MSTPPPLSPPADQDARTQRHLAILDTLIAQGVDLATRVHQQSTTPSDLASALAAPGDAVPFITPDVIASFAQINHTVRRAILLSRKLAEPLPSPAPIRPALDPTARKHLIREVENTTSREARADEADPLGAERHERVESGDLDEHVGHRPVHEIIAEICRDLGVLSTDEQASFQRGAPQDLQTLSARAIRPSSNPGAKAGMTAPDGATKPEPRPPKHQV